MTREVKQEVIDVNLKNPKSLDVVTKRLHMDEEEELLTSEVMVQPLLEVLELPGRRVAVKHGQLDYNGVGDG